jgi:predicted Zn-dependent peptidase
MNPAPQPEITRLPNGLRIATYPMPWMRAVSAGIWATVGGRHEAARENGISHFAEHMLFKGTARRSPEQISADVEGVGGDINAYTSEEVTCYYARAKAEHLDNIADVLCDMYRNPALDPEEIEREREVIREEILGVKDQPSQLAQEALAAALWPHHALGRPLTGTVASVARFQKSDLERFIRSRYTGANTIVAVAGACTHAEAVRAFGPRLASLPKGIPPRTRKAPPRARKDVARLLRQPNEQVQIALAYPVHGRHDRRRATGRLLSAILGEPMCSRLFQELRERHGLCYAISTGITTFQETGSFSVYAACEAGRVEKTLRLVGREFARAASKLVPAKELRRAKDYVLGQAVLGMESTSSRMHWLGDSLAWFERVVMPEDFEREIEAVTAGDLRRYAATFFARGAATVAVGPLEPGSPVDRWLAAAR